MALIVNQLAAPLPMRPVIGIGEKRATGANHPATIGSRPAAFCRAGSLTPSFLDGIMERVRTKTG